MVHKIVVTGAAGFIGSAVVRMLVRRTDPEHGARGRRLVETRYDVRRQTLDEVYRSVLEVPRQP